ncbi:hypothetical protein CEP52_017364 [Fusarium oligoseptatum]|uniref:Uncharacterized protein n=1 Tax=Fusarium oligoseptatum TaxID=2604345 RepID=A0A428RSM9_9HYPO|nr:hypothetical protein CEP52_017364 [Fusarium oligoseptatum]
MCLAAVSNILQYTRFPAPSIRECRLEQVFQSALVSIKPTRMGGHWNEAYQKDDLDLVITCLVGVVLARKLRYQRVVVAW